MRVRTLLLLVAVASHQSGCASGSSELLASLSDLSLQATQPKGGAASLADMMRCGAEMSPDVVRSDWDQIAGRAELNQALGLGDPEWSVVVSAGDSLVNPSGQLTISNNVSWRIFDYFKRQQAAAREADILASLTAGSRLARKQAALLMLHSADDLISLRDAAESFGSEARLRSRQVAIMRIQHAVGGDQAEALNAMELALDVAELRLARANASVEAAETILRDRCGWGANTRIADIQFRPSEIDLPSSFSELVETVLDMSETLAATSANATYLRDLAELKELERWADVSVGFDFSELFSDLRDLPTAPISWAIRVFDQGRFDRELLAARADALIASLEFEEARVEQVSLAAESLLSLLEAKVALVEATATLRSGRRDLMLIEAEVSKGLRSELELAEAELLQWRAATLASAAERRVAIAIFRYELLINESAEVALEKALLS